MSISRFTVGIAALMLCSIGVLYNSSLKDEQSNARPKKTEKRILGGKVDFNSGMESYESETNKSLSIDAVSSEIASKNLLAQVNEWKKQRGYYFNDSIVAYFEQDNFIEHQYFSYVKSELEGLAANGDSAAQVIFAVKYYSETPEDSIHWLKEASINSEFTSSLNMIGMHYMNSALEKDESSLMENVYGVDSESDTYIEGAAWHRVAMLRNDPTGEKFLMDSDYVDFSEAQKLIIEERALSILEGLNNERSDRGLNDYNSGPLLEEMKEKHSQLKHSNNQVNSNGDYLEDKEIYDSFDVIELAFDDDRLFEAPKRETSQTGREISKSDS